MLDIARLERIRLVPAPLTQRVMGHLLLANYRWLPGIDIQFEGLENVPDEPVIFAMNHTDRYNYFPFQVTLWQETDRFTATWVKGKYYENALVGAFMEYMNQLPTVSRGYLITRDFLAVCKRTPSNDEYGLLRSWVDAVFRADGAHEVARPEGLEALPPELLGRPRNVLGHPFDPENAAYPEYINEIYGQMMSRFVRLNERAIETGLDLLIFPQGTRSVQLSRGHIGLAEMALHLRSPIVPVGCSGCDRIYPGSSPFAKRGRVIYRIGEPISYDAMREFHPDSAFQPFTQDAETRHRAQFEGLVDGVMNRINELVDPDYRFAEGMQSRGVEGSRRFV